MQEEEERGKDGNDDVSSPGDVAGGEHSLHEVVPAGELADEVVAWRRQQFCHSDLSVERRRHRQRSI